MTFAELHTHIRQYAADRMPQALSEMLAAMRLAEYLNSTHGTHYDAVSKDAQFEDDGVDASIYNSRNQEEIQYIQVTRAREYDMAPGPANTDVDITGEQILEALLYKCSVYIPRGVYTHGMVLLIVGVTPADIVRDLLEQGIFSEAIRNGDCFAGVYYLTGKEVVDLKGGQA